jgi:hypothetical protein
MAKFYIENWKEDEAGIMGRMKQVKRIRRKLNKGSKMIIHTRIKYSILLIIPLILLILSPAVSLADADRIFKKNSKAVVVVIAYDEKSNAISKGSGNE